ncbi:MAG: transglycosylase domain-containing protein [Aphanocapsa sp. GSE-SYN-MK-11-07L]|jgi:membrane peptidoglycan carboxypeptidase|nr:transglycosylase domain-containing protein [Aphanocapsa sp. GSE-SYN-MK-11-07L]
MADSDDSSSRTFLGNLTQAVQTLHAKVDFSKLKLKEQARVPELWVQENADEKAKTYPLLGDRYVLGRSTRSCDIVVRNPIVSQIHASLERDSSQRTPFVIKDENSTNGIFRGRKRLTRAVLHHKDVLTFGPPELEAAVRVQYIDPPPLPVRILRYAAYGVSGVVGIALVAIAIEWQKFAVVPLPPFDEGPVIVLSRDRVPLAAPENQAHGELKSLQDFSPYLTKAVVASEDSRFYWHIGVDPYGVLRAVITNISGGELREGASTLTQQVARTLFRSYVGSEDSIGRKLREAVVALKLETYYSKDFILLAYLNRVYLGVGNNGFEDAAQFYFDKPAKNLTLAEAATLVGILPAPNSFNPVRDYSTAIAYRNRVIARMAEQGMVSPQEAERARRSRIEVSPKAREKLGNIKAPYYYSYVFDELDALLGKDLAQEGNFIVETGLDLRMQARAEAALRNTVTSAGSRYGFDQGALVTMDFAAGTILAMVGGVDYRQSQFNRATQALRQPGSTFKVFDYTAAIADGISPSRAYSCAPLTWEGQTFAGCVHGSGSMSLYSGIAQSENPIALRLAQDIGLDRVIDMARTMGITSPLKAVPGLVLGQSEVTLLEISRAFAVLADSGRKNPPMAILRVLDAGDCVKPKVVETCRVIYNRAEEQRSPIQALPAEVAATMTDMLQGVVSSGTGRAAALGLGEAGKTGTTNDGRDLWFIGYVPSQNLLTGVWLGNDNNSPTAGSSGQAAELWGNYMNAVIR